MTSNYSDITINANPTEESIEHFSTNNEKWVEIRITAPLGAKDPLSSFLWDNGTQGITEESISREGEAWIVLKAYFQMNDDTTLKESIRSYMKELDKYFIGCAKGRIHSSIVEDQDWNAKWKESFKPLKVSRDIVICPSWEVYNPSENEIVINLDPGMAFGTGTHESTKGCLMAINDLLSVTLADTIQNTFTNNQKIDNINDKEVLFDKSKPINILDVGTGSGILLIAALKLGADVGVGIDIDPLAIESAVENCQRNKLENVVEISQTPLNKINSEFSIVFANILAPVLIELSSQLNTRVKEGGVLILSGLLVEQADRVLSAFLSLNFKLEKRYDEGEWSTLVLTRQN